MAGPPVRERYNAKARGSTAGGSHKKRKRTKKVDSENPTGEDGQVMEVQPEREEEEGESRGKMSSKKRKRMESYIVRYSRRSQLIGRTKS